MQGGSQCVLGGDYGQLAFNAGHGGIMGGGAVFTWPSLDHLTTFLECFRVRNASEKCSGFLSKLRDISSVDAPFRKAYEKMVALLESRTAVPICPSDISGDGVVNIDDLVMVGRRFGESNLPLGTNIDLNGDGRVNIVDLVMVARSFGKRCPQAAGAISPVANIASRGFFASVLDVLWTWRTMK